MIEPWLCRYQESTGPVKEFSKSGIGANRQTLKNRLRVGVLSGVEGSTLRSERQHRQRLASRKSITDKMLVSTNMLL